ncbi:MAG: HAMP domain-containing protein [Anaerolineae bacterium]|nr:MAG: HAMP domain-containing protein [Anaerolineae bacterium]
MSDSQTAGQAKAIHAGRFVSIRWKVLIGFTVLFSIAFVIALLGFTDIAVTAATNQIQADLTQTMEGIAEQVDVDMLLELAATGEPNADGFSDDPRFIEFLDFLQANKTTEPDAWPYLYIKGEEENEIYAVVDLWARYDASSSFGFMEAYTTRSGFIIRGLTEQTYRAVDHPIVQDIKNYASQNFEESNPFLYEKITAFGTWLTDSGILPQREFGTYGDQFGRWASGYMPLLDDAGNPVAAIGVDFEADYVNDVRNEVSADVRTAFLIAYPVLLAIMVFITTVFTRPLRDLTAAAERTGEGDYTADFSNLRDQRLQDEIGVLAGVFEVMVGKVQKREQSLKAQVAQLKIEIDEVKKQSEVAEIVDSDFFRDLKSRATNLRTARRGEGESEPKPTDKS